MRTLKNDDLSVVARNHQMFTLAKIEDHTWTVSHTNLVGPKLIGVRGKEYLARPPARRSS
jgi:hypothetical protein